MGLRWEGEELGRKWGARHLLLTQFGPPQVPGRAARALAWLLLPTLIFLMATTWPVWGSGPSRARGGGARGAWSGRGGAAGACPLRPDLRGCPTSAHRALSLIALSP